jgi:hypothetical protein
MTSLRAWKHLLLALNQAFDQRAIDLILALGALRNLYVTGDGVLSCAGLVASGYLDVRTGQHDLPAGAPRWDRGGAPLYTISLSPLGQQLLSGWREGRQELVVS